MVFWMIVMAANLVVGAFVGLTGVAGFLLPIVYTGPLGMGVTEGLALSFAAFIVSGALGSVNYNKAGNLDIPFGIRLSLGSLAGAVLGVKLNLIIPESTVKVILYVVVLLSGISILLRHLRSPGSHTDSGICHRSRVLPVRRRGTGAGHAPFGGSGNRHQDRGGSGPL